MDMQDIRDRSVKLKDLEENYLMSIRTRKRLENWGYENLYDVKKNLEDIKNKVGVGPKFISKLEKIIYHWIVIEPEFADTATKFETKKAALIYANDLYKLGRNAFVTRVESQYTVGDVCIVKF